jgi:molecular chaperone GrpE (heat shock protein)
MSQMRSAADNGTTLKAKSELEGRIRQIRLEDSLVDLACDLFLEQVPVEMAIQRIQDKAIEKMVPLLDTKILEDTDAMQSCLEMVAEESERVAWKALQKGTEMLEEGLTILEEGEIELPEGGYVN